MPVGPVASDADTSELDATVPDATASDAAAPDAAAPDAAAPNTAAPNTPVPDTTAPDAAVPDTAGEFAFSGPACPVSGPVVAAAWSTGTLDRDDPANVVLHPESLRRRVVPRVAGVPLSEPLRGRPVRWRTAIMAGVAVAVLLSFATVVAALSGQRHRGGSRTPDALAAANANATTTGPQPPAGEEPKPGAAGTISIAAVGDVVMGDAPGNLPVDAGRGMLDQVAEALVADLGMANLEQSLTGSDEDSKCQAADAGEDCFTFRTPPEYAQLLEDAGIDVVNLANDHAYDFGSQGYQNTKAALERVGVRFAGDRGAVTVVPVNGIRVAVVGFAPYSWANDPNDLDAARTVVEEASRQADLVVVQAHLGAEGADRTRVRPGTEEYAGERRGDPIGFAHAVVDAGADLVIGHGPRVLRAMEFYRGRLIAYSLGSFLGYGTLNSVGATGIGGALRITLRADGSFADGALVPTVMVPPGLSRPDPDGRALTLIRGACETDFPETGARLDGAGRVTAP